MASGTITLAPEFEVDEIDLEILVLEVAFVSRDIKWGVDGRADYREIDLIGSLGWSTADKNEKRYEAKVCDRPRNHLPTSNLCKALKQRQRIAALDCLEFAIGQIALWETVLDGVFDAIVREISPE